jgi:hypothetical protein
MTNSAVLLNKISIQKLEDFGMLARTIWGGETSGPLKLQNIDNRN